MGINSPVAVASLGMRAVNPIGTIDNVRLYQNRNNLLSIIAKAESRKTKLVSQSTSARNGTERRKYSDEIEKLNGQISGLSDLASALSRSVNESNIVKELNDKWEQRGADLKSNKPVRFDLSELRVSDALINAELRAVTIATGNLVTEQKYSNLLTPMFPQVSNLVDVVNAFQLQGGQAYTQAFEVSAADADYTDETSAYTETDPVFDKVEIGFAKITSYSELTDEARKLPNVDYQSRVMAAMVTSIRKKIGKQILLGAGGNNQIVGIFNAPSNVMPVANVDITIEQIDETTLDRIVFAHGGDESIEGGQYLVLNKQDLAAFAQVRSVSGEKLYHITFSDNWMTGTISSDDSYLVRFIINSGALALSSPNTASGTYTMAYGSPMVYEMPVFSQIETQMSKDFRFSSGQTAFRSDVFIGGNVTRYRGFSRCLKG